MQIGDDVVWYSGKSKRCRRKAFGVVVRIDGDTALIRRFGTRKRLAKRLTEIWPSQVVLPTYEQRRDDYGKSL